MKLTGPRLECLKLVLERCDPKIAWVHKLLPLFSKMTMMTMMIMVMTMMQ